MNVPMSETGTASNGISVALQPCKKRNTTMVTSISASIIVRSISLIPEVTAQRRVERDNVIQSLRKPGLSFFHHLANGSSRVHGVASRRLIDCQQCGRLAV